jgi:stearoyl-CoA desaturase (delta-9 desaturase)
MNLYFLNHTWYGELLVVVLCGHITFICASLYLHRATAHQGITFHPAVSWAMRWWIWLFTGMSTREWVAVHRKHHAYCETDEDPHSPVIHGWAQILFFGVKYYRDSYRETSTMERFTKGCPNDVIERKLFIPHKVIGLMVVLAVDLLVFGIVPGLLVWAGMVLWIPFWAAGVVNGLGHTIGYRNFKVRDASRNLGPLGILLSGEELHNNHHKFPASAKFSSRWFEFDIGWMYIQLFRIFGLVKVKVVHEGIPNFKRATRAAKEAAIVHAREAATAAKEKATDVKTAVKIATQSKLGTEYSN